MKQFKIDFANGFVDERIRAAVKRTSEGFNALEARLADSRPYLSGDVFSLSDIAWMPNFHRMSLMDWPFERTPLLQAWFERVSARESYRMGLLDWQPGHVAGHFSEYNRSRQDEGTDVRSFMPAAANG